jgi:hypothetical protein
MVKTCNIAHMILKIGRNGGTFQKNRNGAAFERPGPFLSVPFGGGGRAPAGNRARTTMFPPLTVLPSAQHPKGMPIRFNRKSKEKETPRTC